MTYFLRAQASPPTVRVERHGMPSQISGETIDLGVPLARRLVNEDGPGERKGLALSEWIVREENSTLLTDGKCAETLPAGSVSGGDFFMRGVAVPGRLERRPNDVCDLSWNGDDSIAWHRFLLSWRKRTMLARDARRLSDPCAQTHVTC